MAQDIITTDVLVIGSGAGGMSAAICAAKAGLKVLVIEKTAFIGGCTAFSGGIPWVPANDQMIAAGMDDQPASARLYLQNTVGNRMRMEMIDAYLETAPDMLRFFEQQTDVKFRMRPDMPDYASEAPGSTTGGRCLEPLPYDGRLLGSLLPALRTPRREMTLFGGMMVNQADIRHLLQSRRSLASLRHSAGLVLRYAMDRLRYKRGTRLVAGNALAARMLRSAIDCGVTVLRQTSANRLLGKPGLVTGAAVLRDGHPCEIHARLATVVATGGFPQNAEWREKYVPFAAQHRSMAPATNSGDGIRLALEAGAVLDNVNEGNCLLTPVSVLRLANGDEMTFPHLITDRAKPGAIAVNGKACRFVNEANSYHDFVEAMRAHEGEAIPAYLICDRRFIDKYGLGMVRPAPFPRRSFIEAGYLHEAPTIEGLAVKLGLDPQALKATLERYNSDARRGEDTEFGKGSTGYNRYMGDRDHKPNPCIAPVERAPFYALRLQTGDIGTALGIRVNATAQALDDHDRPVEGLYVCGNDMNSLMAGTYATGGITIGPAMTFGFIAARDIVRRSQT